MAEWGWGVEQRGEPIKKQEKGGILAEEREITQKGARLTPHAPGCTQ